MFYAQHYKTTGKAELKNKRKLHQVKKYKRLGKFWRTGWIIAVEVGEGHYQKQRDLKLQSRRVQGPGGLENRRAVEEEAERNVP